MTKKEYELCLKITAQALKSLRVRKETTLARKYLEYARNYFEDARHYASKGRYATALESIAYAHGFIDAGVLAGLFEIKDYHLQGLKP